MILIIHGLSMDDIYDDDIRGPRELLVRRPVNHQTARKLYRFSPENIDFLAEELVPPTQGW